MENCADSEQYKSGQATRPSPSKGGDPTRGSPRSEQHLSIEDAETSSQAKGSKKPTLPSENGDTPKDPQGFKPRQNIEDAKTPSQGEHPKNLSLTPEKEGTSIGPRRSLKQHQNIEDAETSNQGEHPKKASLRSQSRSLLVHIPPENVPTAPPEPEVNEAAAPHPNAVDTQLQYRCPQCSFPCWICHTPEDYLELGRSFNKSNRPKAKHPKAPQPKKMLRTETSASLAMSGGETVVPQLKRKRLTDVLLGPGDEGFEKYILVPSSVVVGYNNDSLQPKDIPTDNTDHDASSEPSVYLKTDHSTASNISAQLKLCRECRCDKNETTFRRLLTHFLVPVTNFVNWYGPQATAPLWRETWKPHKEGPPRAASEYSYDWNIESAMTYMVSVSLFEKGPRMRICSALQWLLAGDYGVCPYLTIEFSSATTQISAASAVWLYQRKKLKDEIESLDYSDFRHYSITLDSMLFQIFEAKFDGLRYSVQNISAGSLETAEGVVEYIEWNNAIHRWGLGPNAKSFKRDVELYQKNLKKVKAL
ncbi:MAG: hypothetical protein M1839_000347 [Geoglossum umbratile]|nr:MAG: hypothetical protein M1839_000347 [Geoglossum umbratile]